MDRFTFLVARHMSMIHIWFLKLKKKFTGLWFLKQKHPKNLSHKERKDFLFWIICQLSQVLLLLLQVAKVY